MRWLGIEGADTEEVGVKGEYLSWLVSELRLEWKAGITQVDELDMNVSVREDKTLCPKEAGPLLKGLR